MSLLQFDDYEIDIEQRRLTEHGQPLRLGGRAFDILSTLVSRAGEVVTKEELISLVWPTTLVDEGSLRVHLVALRKTLGDRARHYVETIPGRGYLFAGDVRPISRAYDVVAKPQPASPALVGNLPRMPKKLVGREESIQSNLELLESTRLLTLAGPGGIGKTAVAVMCANTLAEKKRVVFLDLATLADGEVLLSSLATHLGLNTFGDDVLPGILAELSRMETVLILDGCERVVDAAANVAETILKASTTTQIVTTTREPLRTAMEKVRQIPPLEFPSHTDESFDIQAYPAVELFLGLAALAGDGLDISRQQDLQIVGDIVRSLDGIPLAIELAAARLFDMDLPTLHRSVADPIAFLRRGRRTAPPRQQTMRATLDWSYSTLSDDEKELLLRLSVFAGTFTTDAALSVWERTDRVDAFHEAFDGLFLKSFLVATQRGGGFRLLLTTRDYAREKLNDATFSVSCRQAHAGYCLNGLRAATEEWQEIGQTIWHARYGELVHDVRAAIHWTLFDNGDEELGLAISKACDTLWVPFGLIAEQLTVSERALGVFEGRHVIDVGLEMSLRMSYGLALYHSKTFERNAEVIEQYQRVLDLAVGAGDSTMLMRAIIGIAAIHTSNGHYQMAIDLVHRFENEFDLFPPQARSHLLNHNYHYVGDFNRAMHHASLALIPSRDTTRSPPNHGSNFDLRISALCTIVKTHWIQGRYSAARSALDEALEEVIQTDHAISTCLFLAASANPTAFGIGDIETGAALLGMLRQVSTKNSLMRWKIWGEAYEAVVAARQKHDALGFHQTVSALKGTSFENSLVMGGHLAKAELLERITPEGNWCGAEVLRLRGELAMPLSPVGGRALLQQAFELAQRQAAGTFALKCATSIYIHSPADRMSLSRSQLLESLEAVEYREDVADVAYARAAL